MSEKTRESEMSDLKHTPGPWIIRQGDEWTNSIVTFDGVNTLGEPMYWEVASYNLRRKECRANANLIASAPDLLEALENWINALDDPSDWMKCRDDAKKAIAKAKGE
jgi:hypothetical protein